MEAVAGEIGVVGVIHMAVDVGVGVTQLPAHPAVEGLRHDGTAELDGLIELSSIGALELRQILHPEQLPLGLVHHHPHRGTLADGQALAFYSGNTQAYLLITNVYGSYFYLLLGLDF